MSLERSDKKSQISNLRSQDTYTIWWTFGENRPGGSWDNLSEKFILKKETTGCTYLSILNSRVTGSKFTKFKHNVTRLSKMNLLKSEWRYAKPFWNAKTTNENESADFAHFDTKIGCHGNVPWAIAKDGQTGNLRSNTYHMVKILWKSAWWILR